MTDALAFAKERKAKLETEHTALQQQYTRSQQFLNEISNKIVLVQGRIAENADTLKALETPVDDVPTCEHGEIKRHPLPCPDGKEGCAELHECPGPIAPAKETTS